MSFSPQFLDELRARLSLAQVVGRRVRLTKRGRDYIGLCPFHKEKTPSFNVVEEKGFYHCFGCGAHGDVIGFTMRVENAGFREAVESLARQAGLELPKETPAERERAERVVTLYDACAAAAELFEAQLWGPAGAGARTYLKERGLPDDLVRRFRLGWAPDSRNFLKSALAGRFPEPLLVEAGLLRKGENGDRFDFFRGRVIFPIADRSGRVIAFGGRTLGAGQPKYLNSPETPVFHKGRALYAFHLARAKANAETPPIVTEGYMDVIALHGAGFETAVAPLGTALTEEQIGDLWRLAPEPVICFDGDAAGQRAATRTLDRTLPLLQAGKSLRFVSLPAKHDPDSLIREGGPAAMRSLLAGAEPLSDFLWNSAVRDKVFPTVESIAALDDQLRQRIRTIADRTLQFHLSRFVGDQIWQLSSSFRRRRQRPTAAEPGSAHRLDALLSDEKTHWKSAMVLLAAVLNHPFIAADDVDRFVMIPVGDEALARLSHAILAILEERHDIDAFDLEDRLAAQGFGELLQRIRRSDVYLACKFIHPEADPYDAALGWRAVFSRARLAEAKQELESRIAEYERDPSETNWEQVDRLRRLVAEQNSEAELVPQQRDPMDRWRPSKAA